MDIFTHANEQRMKSEAPLAARMRPRNLDEYVGQEHILGPGKLLRRAIEADRLFSSIYIVGAARDGEDDAGDGDRQPDQFSFRDAFGGTGRQGRSQRSD